MILNPKILYLQKIFQNVVLMLFAKSNHLKGYSVVAVYCPPDQDKINQVINKMNAGFYGTVSKAQMDNNEFYNGDRKEFGNLRDWYGGQFDLLAMYAPAGRYIGRYFNKEVESKYQVNTLGVNRIFARFTYEEVINN